MSKRLEADSVSAWFGDHQAVADVTLTIEPKQITALIGPSGCGKSTFIRTLNRMHETVRGARLEGTIMMDNENILQHEVNAIRRRVGMVFQKSNPFPKSIFDNVAYGCHANGK